LFRLYISKTYQKLVSAAFFFATDSLLRHGGDDILFHAAKLLQKSGICKRIAIFFTFFVAYLRQPLPPVGSLAK
jgi:hypothetical protein